MKSKSFTKACFPIYLKLESYHFLHSRIRVKQTKCTGKKRTTSQKKQVANPQLKVVSQMNLNRQAKIFFSVLAAWVNSQMPVLFIT